MNKKTAAFYAKIFKRQREERHAALEEFYSQLASGAPIYFGPSLTLTFFGLDARGTFTHEAQTEEAPAPAHVRADICKAFAVWLESLADRYVSDLSKAGVQSNHVAIAPMRATHIPLCMMPPHERVLARYELDIVEQCAHPFEYIAMDPTKDWAEHFLSRFSLEDEYARGIGGALFGMTLIWDLWGEGKRRIFSFSPGKTIEVEAALQLGIISRHFQGNIFEISAAIELSLRAEQEAHDTGVMETKIAIKKTSRENGLKGAEARHRNSVRRIAFPMVRDLIVRNPNRLNQNALREAVRRLQIPLPEGVRALADVTEENTVTEWIREIRRAAGITRTRGSKK